MFIAEIKWLSCKIFPDTHRIARIMQDFSRYPSYCKNHARFFKIPIVLQESCKIFQDTHRIARIMQDFSSYPSYCKNHARFFKLPIVLQESCKIFQDTHLIARISQDNYPVLNGDSWEMNHFQHKTKIVSRTKIVSKK